MMQGTMCAIGAREQKLLLPSREGECETGIMRMRADQLLVDRGLAESRSRAQALILAGKVFSGERRIAKAGDALAADIALEVRGQDHPWVSRGGLKLDHALRHFGLSPAGRICLDIGASTGGFTDVLLAHGAAKVHAVDVGHGQLAWKLRSDPRVAVHEKTNARYLTRETIADPIEALVCDASFIGLATLLPAPLALCVPGAWAVALIKPQFEAGRAASAAKAWCATRRFTRRCASGSARGGRRWPAGGCWVSSKVRSPGRKATVSS